MMYYTHIHSYGLNDPAGLRTQGLSQCEVSQCDDMQFILMLDG